MFRATISHRSRFLAGGVCALLAVALAAATASSPAARASTSTGTSTARTGHGNSPAASISPGHWAQVTAPLPNNPLIPEIGLARGSDGVLHVLWTTGGGTTWHVKDTPIAPGGRVGKNKTIATDFLATDPDVTATPSGLVAFWNGIKPDTPGSAKGTFMATRPRSGGAWSASGSAISPLLAVPDTSSPDAAATGSDGKPCLTLASPRARPCGCPGRGARAA